jgi:glyoxylase-like metal-dependent hydrolase (beta-lactamase superfamily II)
MKLGEFDIQSFVEQHMKLDGGSMFGVVPKSLWQRVVPADENNLIDMVTNLFVLRAHGKTVLFEAGLGDTLTEKEQKVYGTTADSRLEKELGRLGVAVEDIDILILTHLHSDHAAGAVKADDGKFVPRFPRSICVVSEGDWKAAMNPNERTAAVYSPDRLRALEKAGCIRFINGSAELLPGITAMHTGGHTEGHYGLEIESAGARFLYYSDIFPMSAHLRLPYIAAADVFPLETLEVKRRMLSQLINTDTVLALPHDPSMSMVRVRQENHRLVTEPVSEHTQTPQIRT